MLISKILLRPSDKMLLKKVISNEKQMVLSPNFWPENVFFVITSLKGDFVTKLYYKLYFTCNQWSTKICQLFENCTYSMYTEEVTETVKSGRGSWSGPRTLVWVSLKGKRMTHGSTCSEVFFVNGLPLLVHFHPWGGGVHQQDIYSVNSPDYWWIFVGIYVLLVKASYDVSQILPLVLKNIKDMGTVTN